MLLGSIAVWEGLYLNMEVEVRGRHPHTRSSPVSFAMTSKVEEPKEGAVSSACRAGNGLMDWVDFIVHMAVCLTCMCACVCLVPKES